MTSQTTNPWSGVRISSGAPVSCICRVIHMAIPRQLGAWNPINRAVTFVKALAFADFESDTRQFESSETASQCGLFVPFFIFLEKTQDFRLLTSAPLESLLLGRGARSIRTSRAAFCT
jgi:hypothetical protein